MWPTNPKTFTTLNNKSFLTSQIWYSYKYEDLSAICLLMHQNKLSQVLQSQKFLPLFSETPILITSPNLCSGHFLFLMPSYLFIYICLNFITFVIISPDTAFPKMQYILRD